MAAVVNSEETVENVATDKNKIEKFTRLPLSRIKTIMKFDPDVTVISQESVILIAKATELFVEILTKEAYTYTAQAKKKTLQKKDVDSCVDAVDSFVFLEGALD